MKTFWKANKINWWSRKKQLDALKNFKTKRVKTVEDKFDDKEKHFKYKEVFNELSNERIGEIYKISKEIDFSKLAYRFKGSNIAPMNVKVQYIFIMKWKIVMYQ